MLPSGQFFSSYTVRCSWGEEQGLWIRARYSFILWVGTVINTIVIYIQFHLNLFKSTLKALFEIICFVFNSKDCYLNFWKMLESNEYVHAKQWVQDSGYFESGREVNMSRDIQRTSAILVMEFLKLRGENIGAYYIIFRCLLFFILLLFIVKI